MKRAFHIAGLLLVLLLGAGPAAAAIGCVLGNQAMGSCPMGMTAMDADCPMSHALSAGDCSQDCCNRAAPIAQVVNAVPVKPKSLTATPFIARLTVMTAAEEFGLSEFSPVLAANSPPRYLLLGVFRI